MGEYLAAPALLDEPAVQQSFPSYFNTIVVSPGDGACLSWSAMRALSFCDFRPRSTSGSPGVLRVQRSCIQRQKPAPEIKKDIRGAFRQGPRNGRRAWPCGGAGPARACDGRR